MYRTNLKFVTHERETIHVLHWFQATFMAGENDEGRFMNLIPGKLTANKAS